MENNAGGVTMSKKLNSQAWDNDLSEDQISGQLSFKGLNSCWLTGEGTLYVSQGLNMRGNNLSEQLKKRKKKKKQR